MTSEVQQRAARIKLLLLDVDGVLTDGKVVIHGDATESKHFDIKDGIAMVWAQRAGLKVGMLSARSSPTTVHRAAQLGITLMYQGVQRKIDTFDHIVGDVCVDDDEVAYMGDDIVDLAVLERVGLAAAPADAVDEVRARVHWVSRRNGGDGAVRELIELILRAQGRWDEIVASYRQATPAGEP
ncbi:MAG: HAD hydrolase family protein [Acidobacteria bacterium]|nr:HAD hydrolase family protein [Acidobacteriota bacterium]